MSRRYLQRTGPFVAAMAMGFLLAMLILRPATPAHAQDAKDGLVEQVARLRADVDRLKAIALDQSHVMKDVAYHYTNLWFAGKQENWPLANFYASETLSHLRWAVRVIPVRKVSTGELKLADILTPIETSAFKDLQQTIKDKDVKRFETAYGVMLNSCQSCHQAVEKPYLRLHVPEEPEARIVDFQVAPQ